MPHECEICGAVPASVKASFDGVILNACPDCAATGRIIEQPKPAARQPVIAYSAPESAETVADNFGKIISKARQRTGLKQEELANKLNEKLSVIQAAEQGKRLDLGLARKLEKFFKISLIELG